MKHVLTSASFLAVGAIALHAYDPEMTRQQSGRPWSVAATVRGFYDDNVATAPDNANPRSSYGIEVSPSAHLNLPLEQTFISLGYIYSLRWYEDRNPHSTDQSHEFNGKLRHQFSPRHDIGIDDSFVVTSEPTIAERGFFITAPQRLRTKSDVWHNRGAIEENFGLTQRLGLSVGYVNNWYDYEQEGTGSRSALLDRLEHLFRADLRYTINPKLVGLVGYTFGLNNYTGDEFITAGTPGTPPTVIPDPDGGPDIIIPGTPGTPGLKSKIRDSYSHYGYVGADYDVTSQLRASGRVGIQYTDYHEIGESSVNPYADASVTYNYLPGSFVQVGVKHARNATDVAAVDAKGRPTLDAESTAVYGQITHQITAKFTGSLIGQYQTSAFNDGANDDKEEDLWLVGINFEYRFNRHWAADAGFNYDELISDVGNRSYDRSRVYLGFRATY
jgi:hypothetical protein